MIHSTLCAYVLSGHMYVHTYVKARTHNRITKNTFKCHLINIQLPPALQSVFPPSNYMSAISIAWPISVCAWLLFHAWFQVLPFRLPTQEFGFCAPPFKSAFLRGYRSTSSFSRCLKLSTCSPLVYKWCNWDKIKLRSLCGRKYFSVWANISCFLSVSPPFYADSI